MRGLTRIIAILVLLSAEVWPVCAEAASRSEINAGVADALRRFYKDVGVGKELMGKAQGALIFPSVFKAGLGIGGEYGEGALRIGGQTAGYYSTASASIGFQIGAQSKTIVILFMTSKALSDFRNSKGWEVGVNGSVALATLGAGGAVDTKTLSKPIIGFVFGNKGLMYNLTLEGSKISKIKR